MYEEKKDIPAEFFLEEKRCDYIVTDDMKKIWAIEIDLLQKLLQVCEKHNIKIFASGGTMLGAIRHKGMIPWDNDIDMMMFREDFDRLLEVAEKEFEHPYFLQTEYNDMGSLRGHAQLRNTETTAILQSENYGFRFNQGIFLDIFPLDSVIEDKKLFEKQYKEAMKYRKLARAYASFSTRYFKREKEGIKGFIVNTFHSLANKVITKWDLERKAYAKFENTCKKYNHIKTEKISTLSLEFNNSQHFKYRNDFEKIIYVPFEYIQIPIGSEYDHILSTRYGNYMEFVKGGSVHGDIIFDVDKPYTEYV